MLLRHLINPLIGQARVRLPPARRCIYCGSSAERLAVEHIIPESIGGGLLLPEATCRCGDKLTHSFEGKVVNQFFQHVRRRIGIKGKKRKRPPEALMLPVYDKFYESGSRPPPMLKPPSEHPSLLCLPRISVLPILGAGQFYDVMDGQPIPFQMWALYDQREKQTGWVLSDFELEPFYRMLAKIGHASAVAALGYDGFSHHLLPVVSGDMTRAARLVGAMPAEAPNLLPFSHSRGLHEIAVGTFETGGSTHVVAQIRLFSALVRGPALGAQSGFFVGHLTMTYAVSAGTIP